MTVLSAMQSAAIRTIGRKPTTFFGASGTFEMEITDLANEVATDIAKYQDWQRLVKLATITGDGVTEVFDLPPDYDRQLQNADIQQTQAWFWGYVHITDINEFIYIKNIGYASYPFPGAWILYDDQIHIYPAPATGATATYPYISEDWALDADSVAKAVFTADTDTFQLPERLLTLGLVWRWREGKGLDGTGDQEAFVKALDEYAAKDRGSRVIRSNGRRRIPNTYPAWPWALG